MADLSVNFVGTESLKALQTLKILICMDMSV